MITQTSSMKAPSMSQHQPPTTDAAAKGCCSHDEIARRAYGIYEESGHASGHCEANWARAEKELAVSGQTRTAVQTMQNEGGPTQPDKTSAGQSYSARVAAGGRS